MDALIAYLQGLGTNRTNEAVRSMDINDFRGFVTAITFIAFIALWYSPGAGIARRTTTRAARAAARRR